jgi:hypothetical protein
MANPYQDLKKEAIDYKDSVENPEVKPFNRTTITNNDKDWMQVIGKIKAAEMLGYYTRVRIEGDVMVWEFVKKPLKPTWRF